MCLFHKIHFILCESLYLKNLVDEASEPDWYIDPPKPLEEISPTPCLLPPELELEWSSIDLMNNSEVLSPYSYLNVANNVYTSGRRASGVPV